MRNERSGQGRPASLMRGSETLSSLAVEVFIEEEGISPCRIVLEAWVCSVRRPPAVCVAVNCSWDIAVIEIGMFCTSPPIFEDVTVTVSSAAPDVLGNDMAAICVGAASSKTAV